MRVWSFEVTSGWRMMCCQINVQLAWKIFQTLFSQPISQIYSEPFLLKAISREIYDDVGTRLRRWMFAALLHQSRNSMLWGNCFYSWCVVFMTRVCSEQYLNFDKKFYMMCNWWSRNLLNFEFVMHDGIYSLIKIVEKQLKISINDDKMLRLGSK